MLHKALRYIRVFHDLKQNEAAERLGVSKSHLSGIESGTKQPTLQLIETYSRVFNMPVSSILFFSETLQDGRPSSTARRFVATKVLNMMRFIEERGAVDGT